MDDSDRNLLQWWQGGSAGSHSTNTGGDKEVSQSPTTPHCSAPNSDWQTLGGELWQELEQLSSWWHGDLEDHRLEQSWLNSDLEDHERNAEFRSQFRIELNGKNFPVAGDGGVATAENLGMCSHATQGQSPKRNQAASQNLKPRRNRSKVDGVKNSKTGGRHRGPNWSPQENRSFLQHMEVEVQKRKPPWKAISESLTAMGFVRKAKACEDHWGVLLADLKRFENHFGSDNILRDLHLWPSVGNMSREQRSQNGLPLVFEVEWFEAIARIATDRAKHRKPPRQHSKGRIQLAGSPSSSSRRQQSRVCAASATTPASEIFDNSLGDCDHGISGLVKLLSSTDRNVTVAQTIEVMKIILEAQKMDLRRQEIELERNRMYEGQRNGLMEKAQRPPCCP